MRPRIPRLLSVSALFPGAAIEVAVEERIIEAQTSGLCIFIVRMVALILRTK